MEFKMNYLQQEDEMDFMPIIALNENDGEGADETPIPAELPLLPLRNTVLFPGVVIPITVGRDKSIKAIDRIIGLCRFALRQHNPCR